MSGGFRSRSKKASTASRGAEREPRSETNRGADGQHPEQRGRISVGGKRHAGNRDDAQAQEQKGPAGEKNGGGGNRGRNNQRDNNRSDHRGGGRNGRRGGGRNDRPRGGNDRRRGERNDRRGGGRSRGQDASFEVPDVDTPRLITLSALGAVFNDGAYGNIALPREITEAGLSGRDAAFATEIGYGTMRMVGVLDEIIGSCSSRPMSELDPIVLNALRMGTYQLLYTRVEDHAAVDTSVRLVPQRVKGFVNAILRAVQKKPLEQWIEELAPEGKLAQLAFRTGHPEWIARSYLATLSAPSGAVPSANGAGTESSADGARTDASAARSDPSTDPSAEPSTGSSTNLFDELAKALEADSTRPIVHLAAKPGEISADELALITGGEEGAYSPYAVYLEGGNPAHIEPVQEKLAVIQDEGSQLIGAALVRVDVDNDAGRWLDLCAGPGGKATMIGSLAAIDGATVTAVEIAPHRGDLIRKATEGLPVTVVVGDGRTVDVGSSFDRVLVDAPCSGLGSLRRRQESRWTKDESDIEELTALQYELLEAGVSRCKPGGVVVYSTCSPDLRETREIVDKALVTLPVEELDAHPLVAPMDNVGREKSVQMWTYRHGTDSMFFAVLRKKAE